MMAKPLAALLVAGLALDAGQSANADEMPAWNDVGVIRENAEEPRAHFVAFRSVDAALAGEIAANASYLSLNGQWKFHFADNPATRPAGFHLPDFDASGWPDIPVPSYLEAFLQHRMILSY